jgi:hypothetical protein
LAAKTIKSEGKAGNSATDKEKHGTTIQTDNADKVRNKTQPVNRGDGDF